MTYPVMSKVYWQRTYEAMLSTPVAVRDVLFGEIGWILFRLLLVACAFFLVIELFGASHAPGGVLAIGAGVLTGLAFATPILAFAATRTGDNGFAVLSRFVITPLFLLGGTFFPISRLAPALQTVAQLTPLYHGVALSRSLTLGRASLSDAAIHVLVLLVYAAAGAVAAYITLSRRLVK